MSDNTSHSPKNQIDETLIAQILKYKNLLRTKNYLSIEEREKDRQTLNFLYDKLHTVKQKILDSKCYLHLGEIQKELASLLLQDETSHEERMFMLAYVLRCVCHPTVHIYNTGKIGNYGTFANVPYKSQENEYVYSEKPIENFKCTFQTKEISPQEIQKIKTTVKKIIKEVPVTSISEKVNWQQAEIISQLAANGEIKIEIESEIHNTPLSIIIKEAR